ncbi:hypothetical protein [Microcoleus sp. D3_18a_C4]
MNRNNLVNRASRRMKLRGRSCQQLKPIDIFGLVKLFTNTSMT